MVSEFSKTYFIDIDGVLIMHKQHGLWNQLVQEYDYDDNERHERRAGLPDAAMWLQRLHDDGHYIILTTGRRENMRGATMDQLANERMVYDQLVMGLPRGARIVVNDRKPNNAADTAFAFSVERNSRRDVNL